VRSGGKGVDNLKTLPIAIVLPCGGGKSVIAAAIAKAVTEKGNRVLFIVHRIELCRQIHDTFVAYGVDMDYCSVSMVQTVSRRLHTTEKPDMIITDEAHHALASQYKSVYEKFKDALHLGFTATPIRLKEGGLKEVFDDLVISVSAQWLVKNKYLSPYKYYRNIVADFTNLKVIRGEYDIRQISTLMETNIVYRKTIELYQENANDKQTICYCPSVLSAEMTAALFREKGHSAIALNAKTPKDERAKAIQSFRDGETKILCNCELFGEGLDVPDVECVVLLRKTKSLTLFIQQSMRAMRYKPEKTAIILDLVGNCNEHGLPDEERTWSLEMKEQEEGEAPIKQCPKCKAIIPLATKECHCGYEFPVYETDQSEVDEDEIELEEVTVQQVKVERLRRMPTSYYKTLTTWNDLDEFRIAKGYKKGWTYYKATELGISKNGFPEHIDTWDKLDVYRRSKGYKFGWMFHKAADIGIAIPLKYRAYTPYAQQSI